MNSPRKSRDVDNAGISIYYSFLLHTATALTSSGMKVVRLVPSPVIPVPSSVIQVANTGISFYFMTVSS
ncbi:hypothetical protein [Wolbachia endosymbiont (group A) of Sympetrum striolatum]|uniref:hypothetical protein n=1 Tax=Wolbachia endosymbiont (group A) of Sympetrum striolatum TaxID=2954061 RepID=UPI00222740CD|nr:hypothetical protein [Wolbachia endosymbiont (group A) of Sympetrum striolatum]